MTEDIISYRVTYTAAGVEGCEDFSDSVYAHEFFDDVLSTLRDVNDRVVLYRIKKIAGFKTYTDAYKFAVMSPRGVLSRYTPFSPKTWQDAERYIARSREHKRHQRESARRLRTERS